VEDLMTLDEFAALIHRDRKTVINWRAQRKPGMPVAIRLGRSVLFRRVDVAEWLKREFADAEAKRAS
jgi:predicted DNA-binding transcriptional regulator AlpA